MFNTILKMFAKQQKLICANVRRWSSDLVSCTHQK